MIILLGGLALFFGPHLYSAFRSRAPGQDMAEKLGPGRFKGLYTLVSLIGLVLIIWGFGESRPSAVIYTPPAWTVHVNMLLSTLAFIALVSAYLPPGYIKKMLKHPMLAAVKLWALGHLLSNGELNSLLLFGAFLAFGVIDRIAVKRRGDVGASSAPAKPVWDAAAIIIGLGISFALIYGLHAMIIGVPILG